ncbi:vasculin-like [Littorina saxatilis]|uniref:Vasculin n=1 Tax=Littorina saxatilis TaxID=31220 RepID=A0AAN9G986_9CAEN
MAASNAPKHDFAPAWLKIPNENTRPAGSKGSHAQDRNRQQRRDENYYNRYGAEYPRGLNRQNSFDMFDASKRYSPSHASKYRHHSVEDDYYYNYAGYGYPYPYPSPYSDPYSMQFGSQSSIQRRDIKYPPPPPHPSRFGQMNGSYQGYNYYYDFFPPGEGFNTYGGGGHSSSKRSHYARDGRGESKESKDSDRSSHDDDDKDKLFNDDFPSLNGTDEDGDASAKTSKNPSSGGVWDNPPRAKFEDGNDLKNCTSGLYKVVPSKGGSGSSRNGSRDSSRVNGSLRDISPLSSVKSGSSRESPQPGTTTQAVEIRRPKTVKTTGSQFIKTLRRENGTHNGIGDYDYQESNNNQRKDEDEEDEDEEEEEEEVVRNGVSDLHLDHDPDQPANGSAKILSSSMEKEFMFMRSLGWNPNETAETEEITEDEKREFLRLTDKLQQRNGRNRILPKSWSPQHMAPNNPAQSRPEVNDTLSSSDTDSDEDL